jgi:predicted ATPase
MCENARSKAFGRGPARSCAITQIERGLAAYRATSAELWLPHFLGLLAEVHAKAGQPAHGLRLLDQALTTVEQTGERWCQPELSRSKGELLLATPEPNWEEAEATLGRAVAVAREQSDKMWELRAAMSLAHLWCDQGRRAEAHDLLAPIYAWFTEGFDTPDLKDAKALLDELA